MDPRYLDRNPFAACFAAGVAMKTTVKVEGLSELVDGAGGAADWQLALTVSMTK